MTTLRLLHQLEAIPQGDGERDYPMTAETIAAAKLAQLRDRAEVYELTGVRISDDGRIRMDGDPFWSMQRMADLMCAAIYGPTGEFRARGRDVAGSDVDVRDESDEA